eukprot:g80316.t1
MSSMDLLYRAKLAEYAERWEEMAGYMKTIVSSKKTLLTATERNMLAVAYKNVVGKGRGSWRSIYTLEVKERSRYNELKAQERALTGQDRSKLKMQLSQFGHEHTLLQQYRLKLQSQTQDWIQELISLLTEKLLVNFNTELTYQVPKMLSRIAEKARSIHSMGEDVPISSIEAQLQTELKLVEEKHQCLTQLSNADSLIFYFKMLGDNFKYLTEFTVDDEAERAILSLKSLGYYHVAFEISQTHLPPPHPIRLGVAYNFSVFYHETMAQPDKACQLAKDAFDEAIAELGQIQKEENLQKDSTLLMQLLKDNLTIWSKAG